MFPDVYKAFKFAQRAHEGQFRKFTNEPFIEHPLRVMQLIEKNCITYTAPMLCGALLHDVLEDTDTEISDLKREFGDEVANIVHYCSSISPVHQLTNRKKRKENDARHYAQGPFESQTIKMADILDNVPSIMEHDPKFAAKYIEEKRHLVPMLTKADPILTIRVKELLQL